MGCIPSKNSVDPEVTTALISPEVQESRNPHPIQSYDVPSSDESVHLLNPERHVGSQHINQMVEAKLQDLIDVPSLAYTLYGTNSPYDYCEDYNSVISSVHVVDGMLNVSTPPEVDIPGSVEDLLQKPVDVDYIKISHTAEALDEKINSMKIAPCSLIVDF